MAIGWEEIIESMRNEEPKVPIEALMKIIVRMVSIYWNHPSHPLMVSLPSKPLEPIPDRGDPERGHFVLRAGTSTVLKDNYAPHTVAFLLNGSYSKLIICLFLVIFYIINRIPII